MRAIGWLLRMFCYCFHLFLSLALLALGGFAYLSGAHDLKIEMLPWTSGALNTALIVLGLVGSLSVILAVSGKLRLLLPLWSIYILGMLIRGVFLSPNVTFSGHEDFHNWLLLTAGALLAMLGSFTLFGRRRA